MLRGKDKALPLGKAPVPAATAKEGAGAMPVSTRPTAADGPGGTAASDGGEAPGLSRSDILALHAQSGYDLERHPAHLIRRAHQRATAAFQAVLSDDDLTPTQYAALASVLKHGELSQNHLGRLTAMDPSTISLVVRGLLKRELITRQPSRTDQRMSMIALTDTGVRYTQERLDSSMEVARRLLEPLSATEQATLLALLRRITVENEGERL